MTNIEKIRKEIERRKDELERDKYINIDAKTCRQSELTYLERFIDSLPDERLTWQDIKKIVNIADAMLDDPKMRIAIANHSEEEYYKMILKEFNNED